MGRLSSSTGNRPMSLTCPLPFRQRCCLWAPCGMVFYICRCCDRGQRYCSSHCRQKARREQRRQANRRHQDSDDGRLDHRDRQKAYRRRHPKKSVTDHTSVPTPYCATINSEKVLIAKQGSISCFVPSPTGNYSRAGQVVCRFCGRTGIFINPFYPGG